MVDLFPVVYIVAAIQARGWSSSIRCYTKKTTRKQVCKT